MVIDGQKQFLYYAEHPRSNFKDGERRPEWYPIHVELPTRMMEATQDWINSGDKSEIMLEKVDQINDRIVNSWSLGKARADSHRINRSRIMDANIIAAVIKYEECRNVKL